MGNAADERAVFCNFLAAMPMFAGSRVEHWSQPTQDPPDVRAELLDGRKIAVELTSWLDESQISYEKKIAMIEASFRDALKPEPPNETEHIDIVWLDPKNCITPVDMADFRNELLLLIQALDNDWKNSSLTNSPPIPVRQDFTKYPTLSKYLKAIKTFQRRETLVCTTKERLPHWITFQLRGGAYSPDSMVQALVDCIWRKTKKYSAKPADAKEFYLLVHYDKAWLYNSPVSGFESEFAEAVKDAAAKLGHSTGVFDKIFVFVPVAEGQQAFELEL